MICFWNERISKGNHSKLKLYNWEAFFDFALFSSLKRYTELYQESGNHGCLTWWYINRKYTRWGKSVNEIEIVETWFTSYIPVCTYMTAILEHTKKLYRLDMRACVLHLGYYSSTYCIIVMSGDISNKIKATECKVMSLDSDSCNSTSNTNSFDVLYYIAVLGRYTCFSSSLL